MQQDSRSESPPKYGPYPGSTIAPNYPTQSSAVYSPPPSRPPPPPPPSPPSPSPPPAPRRTSTAPQYRSPSPESDTRLPYYRTESSTYLIPSPPSTPRRGRRSPSPAEASYVCVDGVCTRLEPGTRTVMLVDRPGRNLSGYLILAIFVMICFNVCFGLIAVIFAILAMGDNVEHSTSMQLGEASLCFSITGIICTIIIVAVVLLTYSPHAA